MSGWEAPSDRRRGPWPVVAAALVLVVAVGAVAFAVGRRDSASGTLAVDQPPQPGDQATPRGDELVAPGDEATDDPGRRGPTERHARPSADAAVADAPTDDPGPVAGGGRLLDPVTTSERETGDGPPLPEPIPGTLVIADNFGLRFVDLTSGDRRRVRLRNGVVPDGVHVVADSLVVSDGLTVMRMVDPDRSVTLLAESAGVVPAHDHGSVWTIGPTTLPQQSLRVALNGAVLERVTFHAVAFPWNGTPDGLLLQSPGGLTLASNTGGRVITPTGSPLGTDGVRLARTDCDADLDCAIVIGTLDEPDGVEVPLAPEVQAAGATFSPDGRRVAVTLPTAGRGGGIRPVGDTIVVDTATGEELGRLRLSDAVDNAFFFGHVAAWSPDGRWLFLGSGTDVVAWDVVSDRAVPIDAGTGATVDVAVW